MKVALAYPYEGHAPDEVIDVDRKTGRRLISDGKARPADAEQNPLVADPEVLPPVRAYAKSHHVSIAKAKQHFASLDESEQPRATTPDLGDTPEEA